MRRVRNDRAEMAKKVAAALALCKKSGALLSTARKKAAQAFDKKIAALMEKLGFKGGLWQTDCSGMVARIASPDKPAVAC